MLKPPLIIKIFQFRIHCFHFFGAVGFFLGVLLGMFLANTTSIPVWPVLLCSLTGAGVLFGLTWLYKVITGREDLVYYQHEIAIIVCCLILLILLKQPVLKYLDIALMGIGVFLVCGRIGCFSVGCCHGRIGSWGVKYTDAHVSEGFHKHFAGIPVFPIQLVESGCVLITVFIGSFAIVNRSLPGTALLLYTVVYGAVRFILEYYRGDTERPYWQGFSEAQWTTLGIFTVSVVLSLLGLLPHYLWHLWALPVLVFGMFATVISRKFQSVPAHKILHPKHVLEIAQGIEVLENHIPVNGEIFMITTSRGLNISRGILKAGDGYALHYTISGTEKRIEKKGSPEFKVNNKSIRILGKLVQVLKHPATQLELVEAEPGIFHLIFPWHSFRFTRAPVFTDAQTANTYHPHQSGDNEKNT